MYTSFYLRSPSFLFLDELQIFTGLFCVLLDGNELDKNETGMVREAEAEISCEESSREIYCYRTSEKLFLNSFQFSTTAPLHGLTKINLTKKYVYYKS
jgi:hypothetical protein